MRSSHAASRPGAADSVTKLRAYEPALVDAIHEIATHEGSDEMHRVGDMAFWSCWGLREVVLPRSITHVGKGAFSGCNYSLASVTLPDSLIQVGDHAFCECVTLMSVVLPNSLTHIGDRAFYKCISLKEVALPPFITHVGQYAFPKTTAVSGGKKRSTNA
jgi:hypothetical protein